MRSSANACVQDLSRASDTEPTSHLGARAGVEPSRERSASDDAGLAPEEFAAAFEAVPTAIVVALHAGGDLLFNGHARALFGATPHATLRAHVEAMRPRDGGGEPLGEAEVPLARALGGELVEGARLLVRALDGAERRLVADARPLLRRGQPLGALCSYRDVTEAELDAEMADELLGAAAHDLRTPLTALKASAQLVARGFGRLDEATRARTLGVMLAQIDKLSARVDDLLDASRIRRGRLDVALGAVDVTATLDRLLDDLSRAQGAPRVAASIEPALTALGDGARIDQLVRRLIFELAGDGRAPEVAVEARRTPEGGATIRVRGATSTSARKATGRRLASVIAARLGGSTREQRDAEGDAVELLLAPPPACEGADAVRAPGRPRE